MLLRFGVANHRSIRDYQELLLTASKRLGRERLTMPVPTLTESAVPVTALYGPNAAGKSNLIDAAYTARRMILDSHAGFGASETIPRAPFQLDRGSREKPTRFDFTFTVNSRAAADPATAEAVYEYGFEHKATEFGREWLYRTVRLKRRSTQMLFERTTRDGQVHVDFGNRLRGENRTIANLTRRNSLFLSAAAQNNHPQLSELYRYFDTGWQARLAGEPVKDTQLAKRLRSIERRDRFMELVRQADIGIDEMETGEPPSDEEREEVIDGIAEFASDSLLGFCDEAGKGTNELFKKPSALRFVRPSGNGVSVALDHELESRGTMALVALLVPALQTLSAGGVMVVDELESSLHPKLVQAFVSLFTRRSSNPHGAQLIFSTHDVALLGSGLLQQDGIWLVDKTDEGASRFAPLTDFRLRKHDNIEKAYRQGRFGAVPGCDRFSINTVVNGPPRQ